MIATRHKPATPDETLSVLEGIFRRLLIPTANAFVVPGIARELLLMRPISPPAKLPFKKSLETAARDARRTVSAIEQLPEEAIAAFNFRPNMLRQLETRLRIFAASAGAAADGESRKGARKNEQKSKIADAVGRHYFGVTGKRPTVATNKENGKAYGQFLETLSDVYAALGVRGGGAEGQAKRVARRVSKELMKRN